MMRLALFAIAVAASTLAAAPVPKELKPIIHRPALGN